MIKILEEEIVFADIMQDKPNCDNTPAENLSCPECDELGKTQAQLNQDFPDSPMTATSVPSVQWRCVNVPGRPTMYPNYIGPFTAACETLRCPKNNTPCTVNQNDNTVISAKNYTICVGQVRGQLPSCPVFSGTNNNCNPCPGGGCAQAGNDCTCENMTGKAVS